MKRFQQFINENSLNLYVKEFREKEINDYLDNDKNDIIDYVTNSCHIITKELQNYLIQKGIKTKRVTGMFDGDKHHWWLETKDKIIDVTADQFGEDEIIITNKNDKRYSE